jgi:predicted O-methyltransferase YrrM
VASESQSGGPGHRPGPRASTDPAAAVDRLLEQLLLGPDPALDAAFDAARAAGLPAIEVSPTQGRLLELLVRVTGTRRVLELGTLAGQSTIALARGLPEGGRVVTLEIDPRFAEVARGSIDRAGLGDRVEIRVGAALETLPQIEAEDRGPFDLIFIDADKQTYPEYLGWALRLARPGTLIIGDNVVRGGAVADPGDDSASIRGSRRFLELLGSEPRLRATAIQTTGVKGHDGIAFAVVLD